MRMLGKRYSFEKASNVRFSFTFCYLRENEISHVGLGFAGIGAFQVLLGHFVFDHIHRASFLKERILFSTNQVQENIIPGREVFCFLFPPVYFR
jgi:hypothetical protein